MVVMLARSIALLLVVIAAPVARGQADLPAQSPTDPTAGRQLTEDQRRDIERHRQIITDNGSNPKSRRVMAEGLLGLDIPAGVDLAIELLASTNGTAAPIAICEAIASIGARRPEQLDARLIDPLLALLGHADAELSTTASQALAAFRDGDIARRLGALASDSNAAAAARVAAVDALAINTDRREVVAELIELTQLADADLVRRVVAALRDTSRVDYGSDVEGWRAWWNRKQLLDDAEWLRDRLDLVARHNQSLRSELEGLRRSVDARQRLVAQRVTDLLRRNYQLTTQVSQREASLEGWLADDMKEYRLGALSLVRERIAEGDPPSETIHLAVKKCFGDPSPEVRTRALEVAGNLKDPGDAIDVLALRADESDSEVIETISRVLGRLENPVAVDVLVAELADASASSSRTREAAVAIGHLAARGQIDPAARAGVVQALRARFDSVAENDMPLKEALLGAMAYTGEQAFLPYFVANLSSDAPEMLLAAIRGIEVVGAHDHLDDLLALLDHPDPRVRQLAAKGVGTLGSEPAHLEALIARLNPNVEANESARSTAWEGFKAVLFRSRLGTAERLAWVEQRLDALPDRQILLLSEMIAEWTGQERSSEALARARDKLAGVLVAQGRFAEAVPHYQQLRAGYVATNDPRARSAGIALIRAILESGRHEGIVKMIVEVASSPGADADHRIAVTRTVLDYLESLANRGDTETLQPLLRGLRSLGPEIVGPDWTDRLTEIEERAASSSPAESEPIDP